MVPKVARRNAKARYVWLISEPLSWKIIPIPNKQQAMNNSITAIAFLI